MSDSLQPDTSTPADGSSPNRRSSLVWTQAESAAGCVLRYVTPMRAQLTELFGDAELADQAIALLLSHLAKKGYSGMATGRLRTFLIRGIRSAAKVVVAGLPEDKRPAADPATLRSDSETWLGNWRQCLLEATWRALEREEHQNPETCGFTALWTAKEHPKEALEALASRVALSKQQHIDPQGLAEQLQQSRKQFRELLAREVAGTLENPTPEAIQKEIADLKLSKDLP